MADEAPASLRQADPNIYKTATRAAQLQSVKPIVAYWCEYWVLKQIISKSLHTTSPDILEYSTRLMDKLEQTKADHAHEDAILDDTAGQAYVEQFAQETLDRAQRVVRANKVTATTANTFDAAASFFGLVNVWGTPDPETLQKIKYAKWNAARILKAIKEGKDPNESNPHLDELQEELPDAGSLSPGTTPAAPAASAPRPVTIEDESETERDLRRDSAGVSLPRSPTSVDGSPAVPHADIESPPSPPIFDPGSIDDAVPDVPSPPTTAPTFLPAPPSPPPQVQPSVPDPDREPFYQPQPPPAPSRVVAPAPAPVRAPAPVPVPAPTQWTQGGSSGNSSGNPANIDDLAMANAQKHAKWAISALNFEDVSTAVRELRKALELLGQS